MIAARFVSHRSHCLFHTIFDVKFDSLCARLIRPSQLAEIGLVKIDSASEVESFRCCRCYLKDQKTEYRTKSKTLEGRIAYRCEVRQAAVEQPQQRREMQARSVREGGGREEARERGQMSWWL